MKNSSEDRLLYIRRALATVISDEVDSVEDDVGYVRPEELLIVRFDIAVKFGRDSAMPCDQVGNLFNHCMTRRTVSTFLVRTPAEA